MSDESLRAAVKERLEQQLGYDARPTERMLEGIMQRVLYAIDGKAKLVVYQARQFRELMDHICDGDLRKLLDPERIQDMTPSEISRGAMGFLLRKQYTGRTPPDCESVRALMAN